MVGLRLNEANHMGHLAYLSPVKQDVWNILGGSELFRASSMESILPLDFALSMSPPNSPVKLALPWPSVWFLLWPHDTKYLTKAIWDRKSFPVHTWKIQPVMVGEAWVTAGLWGSQSHSVPTFWKHRERKASTQLLFSFVTSQGLSLWDRAPHVHAGSSPVTEISLAVSSQKCPRWSEPSQADNEDWPPPSLCASS